MSDPIDKVLKQVCALESVQKTRLTNNFVNNVAEIFERQGFAVTRLYLKEKKSQRTTQWQASALLEVLPILEGCERIVQNRAIGRLVIKVLPTLQERERKRDRR